MFAATLTKMHDPVYAPIELDLDLDLDKRVGRVRVAGVIDTSVGADPQSRDRGGTSRAGRRSRADSRYHEAEYANGATRADGPIKLALDNSHAHVYEKRMNMTTQGVV